MMPDRIMFIYNHFWEIAMTIIGFFLMISFGTLVAIFQLLVIIFYWIPTIYHKSVKRYYNGSWKAWAKQFNAFQYFKKK